MEKKVLLKNYAGKRIVGLINYPKTKPPYGAVVICHGFKGYKEQIHLKSLAQALARFGILAFRFDMTNGVGESAGKIEDITFSQGLKDLDAVYKYVANLKSVDKDRIGLAGHSLGAQMILHFAAKNPKAKVLADLAGVVSWGNNQNATEVKVKKQRRQISRSGYLEVFSRSKNQTYRVKSAFFNELLKLNSTGYLKKIKQPTLIVHGTKDESVGLTQAKTAFRLLSGPKKIYLIKGAPHTWRRPGHYQKINTCVVNWFVKYL